MAEPRSSQQRLPLRSRIGGLLIACLAYVSCVSPTLPPDEPPAPAVELGEGVAYLRGAVPEAPAFVLVHNRDSGLIYGQRTATGAYAFEVGAEECDLLALWYQAGSYQSTAVVFRPAIAAGDRGACRDASEPPDAGDAAMP